MKYCALILLFASATLFACANTKPVEAEEEQLVVSDAFIKDTLNQYYEIVKRVFRELAEHGKEAGIALLQQLIETASGFLKEMLVKLLQSIEKQSFSVEQYSIKDTLNQYYEIVKRVFRELAEHGKEAGIALLQQLIETASGFLKEMLVKLLESIEKQSFSVEQYSIKDTLNQYYEIVKRVFRELAEHGKEAGIALLQQLIETASGFLKEMLVKLLQSIEKQSF